MAIKKKKKKKKKKRNFEKNPRRVLESYSIGRVPIKYLFYLLLTGIRFKNKLNLLTYILRVIPQNVMYIATCSSYWAIKFL